MHQSTSWLSFNPTDKSLKTAPWHSSCLRFSETSLFVLRLKACSRTVCRCLAYVVWCAGSGNTPKRTVFSSGGASCKCLKTMLPSSRFTTKERISLMPLYKKDIRLRAPNYSGSWKGKSPSSANEWILMLVVVFRDDCQKNNSKSGW